MQAIINIAVSFSFPVLIVVLGDPGKPKAGDFLHGSADTFLIFAAVAICGFLFVYVRSVRSGEKGRGERRVYKKKKTIYRTCIQFDLTCIYGLVGFGLKRDLS